MSANKKMKLAKLEGRADLPKTWDVTLMQTCPTSPGFFAYAVLCSSCASFTNRKKALRGDMSRYICCNGDWPCSGKMKEQDCPYFCLGVEVFCCFAQSVASTRWLLQDEMAIRNTKCDNCIIQTMVALQFISCFCNILACLTSSPEIDQAAELVDLAADIAWCTVCGCMQTQAHTQMDNREKGIGGVNPLEAPGPQRMDMNAPYQGSAAPQLNYGPNYAPEQQQQMQPYQGQQMQPYQGQQTQPYQGYEQQPYQQQGYPAPGQQGAPPAGSHYPAPAGAAMY